MREKHILILAVVLLGLVIYYNLFESNGASKKSEERPGTPVFLLQYGDVKKLHVVTSDDKELVCERQGRGWSIIKGRNAGNGQEKIDDFVVSLLMTVEIDKILSKNVQLDKFGLKKPAYQINLTDITDKSYQLLAGDTTPTGTCIYAKLADSPDIIIVGALLKWELSKIDSLLIPAEDNDFHR